MSIALLSDCKSLTEFVKNPQQWSVYAKGWDESINFIECEMIA